MQQDLEADAKRLQEARPDVASGRTLIDVGPLGELGALFNPGMRHEIEERQSKENRREEEGNARDGDLRIDLASGVAVINAPGKPANRDAAGEAQNRSSEETTTQQAPHSVGGSPAAVNPQTAAQRRAAARSQRKHSAQDAGNTRSKAVDTDKTRTPAVSPSAPVPSSKASRAAR